MESMGMDMSFSRPRNLLSARNSPSQWKRARIGLFVLALFTCIVVVMFSTQLSPNVERGRKLLSLNRSSDIDWLIALRTGAIIASQPVRRGKSIKFRVTLDTGVEAVAKLIHPDLAVFHPRSDADAYHGGGGTWIEGSRLVDLDRPPTHTRRSGGYQQGWSEVPAFHLDRVLALYRKAPAVARAVSNKVLYAGSTSLLSPYTWVRTLLPSYPVKVTLIPWVDSLRPLPIPSGSMAWLSGRRGSLSHFVDEDPAMLEVLLGMSDVLMFDFLADDHDRKYIHNWMHTPRIGVVAWDSGLSLKHGPFGVPGCLDILCGIGAPITEAKGRRAKGNRIDGAHVHSAAANATQSQSCARTCIFRRETVATLRELDRASPSFGTLITERVNGDSQFPGLDSTPYLLRAAPIDTTNANGRPEDEIVRFSVDTFARGYAAKLKVGGPVVVVSTIGRRMT
eukprot:TRINITY_DN577_c0_g2_i4.p1 TRINITY_DN577_c0_g2~~TRINITY_DN577_c0_g2_i4.p1  ORF type:complete len:450 (+),score=54.39 TRINITY_DN577_c0_g2_i4:397-1746(+)